jgi:hypothetical protein
MGWDNMMWKDDEKRRNDVGFGTFAAEKFFGPMYTYTMQDLPKAWNHFQEGHIERGVEALLPKAASNIMKGTRYMVEGATTKDGTPIKQDVSAYNALMQVAGFAPADLAEIQKENSGRIGLDKNIYNAKRGLLTRVAMARMAGDDEEVQDTLKDVRAFNAKHRGAAITTSEVQREVTKHYQRLSQSVHGVSLNPKLRLELMAAYPDEE